MLVIQWPNAMVMHDWFDVCKWAMQEEKGGQTFGYDNFPYLSILDLKVQIALDFRVFRWKRSKYKNNQKFAWDKR